MRKISFSEACKLNPGAADLWRGFVHELNDPENRKAPHWLVQHSSIIADWLTRWAKSVNDEQQNIVERLQVSLDIQERIKSLHEAYSGKTVARTNDRKARGLVESQGFPNVESDVALVESKEGLGVKIGYLKGLLQNTQPSQEYLARADERKQCYRAFYDAYMLACEEVGDILKDHYQRIGEVYPAVKPQPQTGIYKTGEGPHDLKPEVGSCFCKKCWQDVPNPLPQEPCSHSYCKTCGQELTFRIWQGGDKRAIQDQDRDFSGKP